MTAHRIRLSGHWQATPLPDGRTRHARRFGRPRTLDENERLWLVGACPSAMVSVNGTKLGDADGAFAFDVTAVLLSRNEVSIDTAGDGIFDVALEVRTNQD